jgi:hypothetical protein
MGILPIPAKIFDLWHLSDLPACICRQYGAGLTTFTGGGVLQINWAPVASAQVVRYSAGTGENFVSSGWENMFNSTRFGFQASPWR